MTSVNDIKTAAQRYDSVENGYCGPLQDLREACLLDYVADLRAYAEQRDKRVGELEAHFEQHIEQLKAKNAGLETMLDVMKAERDALAAQVSQPVGAVVDTPELIALLDDYARNGTKGYEACKDSIVAYFNARINAARAAQTATPGVKPYGYAYECVQPFTNRKKWCEFFSRDPVEADKNTRNVITLYTAPAAPLDISGLTRYAVGSDGELYESVKGNAYLVADVQALIDAQKGGV